MMFNINKKDRMNRVISSSTIVTTKAQIQQLILKHKMEKDTINMNIDNANFKNYWIT